MIQTEPRGRTLILRFDRPDKRNAQTPGMLPALVSHLATAASTTVIVLSGVGDLFCVPGSISPSAAMIPPCSANF